VRVLAEQNMESGHLMDQMGPYAVTKVRLSEKSKQDTYNLHKTSWLSA
jgi:hypothetical protein